MTAEREKQYALAQQRLAAMRDKRAKQKESDSSYLQHQLLLEESENKVKAAMESAEVDTKGILVNIIMHKLVMSIFVLLQ